MFVANPYYTKWVAITPSDTIDFVKQGTSDNLTSAIYIGGAGNVVVVFQDGSTATIAVIAAQTLAVRARRVNATSTTATAMFALYAV